MDLEQTIVGILAASAPVTALIAARLFPNHARQGTQTPYAVYTQEGGNPEVLLDGTVSPLASYRMQLQVSADTFAQAKAVASALTLALIALRGQTPPGLKLAGVFVEDGADDYSPPMHDDDVGVYGCTIDLLLWYYTS